MSSSPCGLNKSSFAMPFGTCLLPGNGVLFRLWAPMAKEVDLCLFAGDGVINISPMTPYPDGWFILQHQTAQTGDCYQFRIDGGLMVPDPVSRRQADDIHGPSVVCDPEEFCWQDQAWRGRPWQETIIYELHVGTFSQQGSFQGVIERLDYCVELGITAIELMPVAHFPGYCNWGYDGALLFAPCTKYGRPEDLKELVQAAHQRGLMVFLDVVYNHFGPEGNYLYVYAKDAFFTEQFHTPWGDAIRFSGTQSSIVRDFYISNVLYWLEEYHFDGLRFDAVHTIFDQSEPDILEEMAMAVNRGPGSRRHIHLILENDNNCTRYLANESNGDPRFFRAQWNDDIHHACHVLLTGETEGYYADYSDNPIGHLGRCLTEGFAYQGETSRYRKGRPRGEPSAHLSPLSFISFLQNHDQIGNRAFGERLIVLSDQHDLKICIALVLLAPSPPLLFMGEEFGAEDPFYFFCDFSKDLAENVTRGRREEFAGFPKFHSSLNRSRIPDPNAKATFLLSKLDWDIVKKEEHAAFLKLYRRLLAIRKSHIIPRLCVIQNGRAGYQVMSQKALKAWWVLADESRLSVLFNMDNCTIESHAAPSNGNLLYHLMPSNQHLFSPECLPPKSIFWYLEERERNDV